MLNMGALILGMMVAISPVADTPLEKFRSEEVEFKNGELVLAGTLTLPKEGKGPFPAVVIISGSGLQDRDGGLPAGNLYKAIAERLSENGIAVLRHDDRGIGKSGKLEKPYTYTDFVNDTKAAVAFLRARKDIDPDRVGLVGHSEGAGTAIKIAAEDKRLAGIALLAGCSTVFDKMVLEQAQFQSAMGNAIDPLDPKKLHPTSQALLKLIEKAKAGEKDTSFLTPFEYLREHLAFDPKAVIKKVECPIAVLQGERDYLVLAYHAVALAQAASDAGNKRVVVRVFPGLSHVFMPLPFDKNATEEERKAISVKLLDTLTQWASETMIGKAKDAPK